LACRDFVVDRDIDRGNQTVDGRGTVLNSTIPQKLSENFTMAHADVLVSLQRITNGFFNTSGGDQVRLSHLLRKKGEGNM
jgi:hypothetical protein